MDTMYSPDVATPHAGPAGAAAGSSALAPNMTRVVIWALAAVLSVSSALNAFFLKETLSQLRQLQANDVVRAVAIARLEERTSALGQPSTSTTKRRSSK